MPMFIVLPKNSIARDALTPVVIANFADANFLMPSGAWLLSGAGTSKQISDQLGITGGDRGPSAIVFTITGYHGRAPNDVWEWLKIKMEAGSGA